MSEKNDVIWDLIMKDDLMWDIVVLVGIVIGFWAAIGFIALIHHL